jgi:hypothetical protein
MAAWAAGKRVDGPWSEDHLNNTLREQARTGAEEADDDGSH